jgi:hypothetical protein
LETTEFAGPIQRVEKAPDNISPDRFFYSLQAGSAFQKFIKSQAFAIIDNVKVSQGHQARRK